MPSFGPHPLAREESLIKANADLVEELSLIKGEVSHFKDLLKDSKNFNVSHCFLFHTHNTGFASRRARYHKRLSQVWENTESSRGRSGFNRQPLGVVHCSNWHCSLGTAFFLKWRRSLGRQHGWFFLSLFIMLSNMLTMYIMFWINGYFNTVLLRPLNWTSAR